MFTMSTVRLPNPGSDDGQWGEILNTFLSVEHDAVGSLKKSSLIDGAEQLAHKSAPLGYPSLDENGVVPVGQLPSYISNAGNYISLRLSTQEYLEGSTHIIWETMQASRGSSVTWDPQAPDAIQINDAGVYCISFTVDWLDMNISTEGHRAIGLSGSCGFRTMDSRRAVTDGTSTKQIVQFISFLQPGDDVYTIFSFGGASALSPDIQVLVTLISGTNNI
jgi:hypothetical protein